jgi:PIN domain nuclease of toxin-antitoxin system
MIVIQSYGMKQQEAYLTVQINIHLHRDPFDHVVVVQNQMEDLPILTADENIRRYNVARSGSHNSHFACWL